MLNHFLRFKIIFTVFILVITDQIFKNAALAFFVMPRPINGLLSWEIYKNYGLAFGLPVSANEFYFAVFIFLIFIFVGWKKGIFVDWREMDREKIFAAALVAAGALGNMIDRIKWGYIIDYINIGGLLVFNLADAMITIGVLILLKDLVLKTEKITRSELIKNLKL